MKSKVRNDICFLCKSSVAENFGRQTPHGKVHTYCFQRAHRTVDDVEKERDYIENEIAEHECDAELKGWAK